MGGKNLPDPIAEREKALRDWKDERKAQSLASAIVSYNQLAGGDEIAALCLAPSLIVDAGEILRDVRVLAIDVAEHERAGAYPILTISASYNGTMICGMLHAIHSVLQDQLASLDVQVGTNIEAIASLGERTKDNGETYGLWKVLGAGREIARYDWGTRKAKGRR